MSTSCPLNALIVILYAKNKKNTDILAPEYRKQLLRTENDLRHPCRAVVKKRDGKAQDNRYASGSHDGARRKRKNYVLRAIAAAAKAMTREEISNR